MRDDSLLVDILGRCWKNIVRVLPSPSSCLSGKRQLTRARLEVVSLLWCIAALAAVEKRLVYELAG